jgi:S-adenosylmethionine:tRNA ribosyltransferase-isomerase
MHPRDIQIADYQYELPDEKIARFPLSERDESKLLVYQSGQLAETRYRQIADFIPADTLLVLNNTKVVEARLLCKKPTGGQIEIFCLEPAPIYPDIVTAMQQRNRVHWICLVGGAAKWKSGLVLTTEGVSNGNPLLLESRMIEKNGDAFLIEFSWNDPEIHFAEVLHLLGNIPIPPYLKRAAEESDEERYQTIYAEADGSVAAPTAGLHFTPRVFEALQTKKVQPCYVTLHVGAGTFKPVSTDRMEDHPMHAEFIDVTTQTIQTLLDAPAAIYAVGTTSLRTLESLYWMGVKAAHHPDITETDIRIQQWEVYDHWMSKSLDRKSALKALLSWMKKKKMDRLITITSILIAPGYRIQMINGLITNFHQPQSTLLLLIAALIGDDWRNVYAYALANDFRFLSYGDGCLLVPKENPK